MACKLGHPIMQRLPSCNGYTLYASIECTPLTPQTNATLTLMLIIPYANPYHSPPHSIKGGGEDGSSSAKNH